MTKLNLIDILTKIKNFFKEFWHIIVFIIGIIAVLFFYSEKEQKFQELVDKFNQEKQTVESLRRAQEEETRKHAEIERQYRETLAKIETEHSELLGSIDENKQTEIHRIIEETHGNPEELSQRINHLFNVPIYRP